MYTELQTKRLYLRALEMKDSSEILVLHVDDEVNRYLKRKRQQSMDEARAFVKDVRRKVKESKVFYWAISLKGDTTLVGTICLWNITDDGAKAEVGFELKPKCQNKGLMTEALTEVARFGFEKLNLKAIEAFVHHKNESSKNLLIKNNFRHLLNKSDVEDKDNLIFQLKND